MGTGTVSRVDPFIVVSFTTAILLLGALSTSEPIVKVAHMLVQVGWLYLTNTRG